MPARSGSTLRDAHLPTAEHLTVGASLLWGAATVPVEPGAPFRSLADVTDELAAVMLERQDRLLDAAPIRFDAGLTRYAADVMRSVPLDAPFDPPRIAAWCIARDVESAWRAADHGWWTGFRGADGDLDRSAAWASAADALGGV